MSCALHGTCECSIDVNHSFCDGALVPCLAHSRGSGPSLGPQEESRGWRAGRGCQQGSGPASWPALPVLAFVCTPVTERSV